MRREDRLGTLEERESWHMGQLFKCEVCGAYLNASVDSPVIQCAYCKTKYNNPNVVGTQDTAKANRALLSIPSCGVTMFSEKTFNIYKHYAELVDNASGEVDIHLDYARIASFKISFSSNLVFKLVDGSEITIKCMSVYKTKEALNMLLKLI